MSSAINLNLDIKGMIFDLDGVIADTAHLHYKAWCKIAWQWKFNLSVDQNEKLKGVSRNNAMRKIANWAGKNLSEKELENFADQKNTFYLNYCESLSPEDTLPGVVSFIDQCRRTGMKLAVGSASKNAKIILQKLQIIDVFQIIVDGNMVEKSKPHPEVFLKAAELMKIKPSDCVVFEDSQAGIQAAINAGMMTIGIGSSDLRDCNAQIQSFEKYNLNKLISQINN
jgi:beta-phosphoglucomutase